MGLKKVSNLTQITDEDEIKKLVKKTNAIYIAFKKGTAIFDYNNDIKIKYRYVFGDDYDISIEKSFWRNIVDGETFTRITFPNMTIEFIDFPEKCHLQKDMSRWKTTIIGKIEKKFLLYNVKLGLPKTILNITQK
jgi:hypothetical protein